MLDPTGVHLQEKLSGRVTELDRSRADVSDRSRGGDRSLSHFAPQGSVERGAGSLLDDLLMTPLDAALPFEEVDHVARAVAEDLELDVPGVLQELLEVDSVVSERGAGNAPALRERPREVLRRPTRDIPLPPPPADAFT